MSDLFPNQDFGRPIYKHVSLPIYVTDEFVFYRCLEFNNTFYHKTASELFNGNLRYCTGRYAKLFSGQMLSYWADSPKTARAEVKKHGAGNNILTFWAYDDATSTFPCLANSEPLKIIDGRRCGVQELIDKLDDGITPSNTEKEYMDKILAETPDCLAYESHAYKNGMNFLFLEKGFKKLALRELQLRFGKKDGDSHSRICCAVSSDYSPVLEGYADCFMPKARISKDENYYKSQEYIERKRNLNTSYDRYREAMK